MRAFIASMLLATGCPANTEPGLAPYVCAWTPEAPVIDGSLSDAVWARMEALPIESVLQGDTGPGIPRGSVKMCYDATHLYVAFDFEDRDIQPFSANDDDTLWLGDVAELFLKPAENDPRYFEFNVAPNAALMDARFPERGHPWEEARQWSSGAEVKATLVRSVLGGVTEDFGYFVEMAIPLAALETEVKAGDVWSFGAFRYDYGAPRDEPILLMAIPKSRAGFHAWEDYRPLQFAAPATGNASR
jgi:hypothetical protein